MILSSVRGGISNRHFFTKLALGADWMLTTGGGENSLHSAALDFVRGKAAIGACHTSRNVELGRSQIRVPPTEVVSTERPVYSTPEPPNITVWMSL